jgi:3-hydroxyacyl-[acyl-carrier-protein] dehydratase
LLVQTSPQILEDALRLLPHGPRFRFVDRLVALEPGHFARGEYSVTREICRGHFPGKPLMPGVLMIEACAQMAGIVAQTDPQLTPYGELKLTAVRNAKITGSAVPGESLLLEARLQQRLGNLIQVEATASTNGQVVCVAFVTMSGGTPREKTNPPRAPKRT